MGSEKIIRDNKIPGTVNENEQLQAINIKSL